MRIGDEFSRRVRMTTRGYRELLSDISWELGAGSLRTLLSRWLEHKVL